MKPSDSQRKATYERLWWGALFGFSAAMAASALVDLQAGRIAGAMGDAGVGCLMISLMHQFPLVRAIVASTAKEKSSARDEMQREVDRLREAYPWSERVANAGWTMFLGSIVLRVLGVD